MFIKSKLCLTGVLKQETNSITKIVNTCQFGDRQVDEPHTHVINSLANHPRHCYISW